MALLPAFLPTLFTGHPHTLGHISEASRDDCFVQDDDPESPGAEGHSSVLRMAGRIRSVILGFSSGSLPLLLSDHKSLTGSWYGVQRLY